METRSIMIGVIWVVAIVVVLLFVGSAFWLWPQYGSYSQRTAGENMLMMAEWNQRIAVQNAKNKAEVAKLEAQAEIERARGVAEATRILGESLSAHPTYLKYLWIQAMANGTNQVIYVPTEGQIPIVDAPRASFAVRPAP